MRVVGVRRVCDITRVAAGGRTSGVAHVCPVANDSRITGVTFVSPVVRARRIGRVRSWCVITFMSFKSGVGKTTALMTVASTLLERGHKIACFEADDNRPLSAWRENGIEHGTWDAQCAIYPALSIDLLSQSYEIAERDGVEFGLIDTRGGGSDLNQSILINSDLTIIPTGLSPLEVEDTLETLQYIVRLHKHYEISSAYGKRMIVRSNTRLKTSSPSTTASGWLAESHMDDLLAEGGFKKAP